MHSNAPTVTNVHPLRGVVTLYVNGVPRPGLEFMGYACATTGDVYQWQGGPHYIDVVWPTPDDPQPLSRLERARLASRAARRQATALLLSAPPRRPPAQPPRVLRARRVPSQAGRWRARRP